MPTSVITTNLVHLLAAYFVLAAPWLGRLRYRNTQRRLHAGDPLAKLRLYRQWVIKQTVIVSVFCGLWLFGGIPRTRLGLRAPRSWWLSAGLAAAIVGLLVWSAIRLRRKAGEFREKLPEHVGALLPDSPDELLWFAAASLGGGIAEELAYRGFLFDYIGIYLPHLNILEKGLLTSLIFGMAHLYQGWRGVAASGLAGLMLAALYLLSGSLLLPMVVHVMGNLRATLIFFPSRSNPGRFATLPLR